MIGQYFFIKSTLKPSGLGALLEGRALTAASITVVAKLSTRLERSGGGLKKEARSKLMLVKLLVLNFSLKECYINGDLLE